MMQLLPKCCARLALHTSSNFILFPFTVHLTFFLVSDKVSKKMSGTQWILKMVEKLSECEWHKDMAVPLVSALDSASIGEKPSKYS
jgi:hypothetical protein